MLKKRLAYKLFMVFAVFAAAILVPLSMMVYTSVREMLGGMEQISPLLPEQSAVHEEFLGRLTDRMISLSFYSFVLAFIISMFLSRRFLLPVKALYKGAEALKEGSLDVRLDVTSDDELAEVTRSFNDMVEALRKKSTELSRKDTYIKTMVDPLCAVDLNNVITDINPAFTKMFGYGRDEALGTNIFDLTDEADERKIRERLYLQEEDSEVSDIGVSIISKSGETIPVMLGYSPLRDGGEVIGRLGIMRDFRGESRLRDELNEAKEYNEAIVDSMLDGMVVVDREYRIVKHNRAATEVAGEGIAGRFCYEVFRSETEACFTQGAECPVRIVFETGRSHKSIYEHVEGGKKVFYETVAYPIKDRTGNINHVVELMRDITVKKHFEDEIARRNKELTTLNNISKLLSRSLRQEDIFSSIIEKLKEMLGMSGGGIYIQDEDVKMLECRFQSGLSEEFLRSFGRVRVGEGIFGRVAVTGQAAASSDIRRDAVAEGTALRHSGIRALACFPIRGKEKVIGVFFVFSMNTHIFTPEEERILYAVGEMSGIAFENIRLYEKMRSLYEAQRVRRAAEQRNLLELSSTLSAALDIEEHLESVVSGLRKAGAADFCWLLELDKSGNLVLGASTDGGRIPRGWNIYKQGIESIESRAVSEGKPVAVPDISRDTRSHVSEYVMEYASACSVPITVGRKALGAFTLYYKRYAEPQEEDIYFYQTTASILAVALERAKLYEKVLLEKGLAETVLQNISHAILMADINGTVVSLNKALTRLTDTEFQGPDLRYTDIFGPQGENPAIKQAMAQCLEDAVMGKTGLRESTYVSPDGAELFLRINSAPVYNASGNVTSVVYVLRDIAEERQMERMREDFIRSVSEEFRAPLSGIVGMTEMLLEDEGVDRRKYLETILEEGGKLSGIVSDLLDLARLQGAGGTLAKKPVDFKDLLMRAERSLGASIKAKKARFTIQTEGNEIKYLGDPEGLEKLVVNLAGNALKRSDEAVTVNVKVKYGKDSVVIEVSDNGGGMPDEDLESAGEKFFRGKGAGETGRGLSLCREIVKAHGGKLVIENKKGKGTTVRAELPSEGRP